MSSVCNMNRTCIRLRNGDIERLYRLVPVGTPTHVCLNRRVQRMF